MSILVTGCCGFIGSHLCEKLLKLNKIVIGIDNLNNYYDIKIKKTNLAILKKYKHFSFYKEDIVNTNIIEEVKPYIIVNLAAMAGVRYSLENPKLYIRNNVEGQTHLLEQSIKNNAKLFIYASSSSVYGKNSKIPFTETDKLDNINSPYAASKRSCEIMANLYHRLYGLPVIGLRFFTVYGPRGRPDMAPYKFLSKILKSEKIDKYGDGESYRDYTYIDDIIEGIIGAIKNKNNKSCEIYNLGNSTPISLNNFIKLCEKVTQKKAIFNQLPDQPGDVPKTYSNINKAKKDLDYNPLTKLEDGLRITCKWLKKEFHK
jgi:UDP-glucuronate 4-epimerase